jgi:hypothetical protein
MDRDSFAAEQLERPGLNPAGVRHGHDSGVMSGAALRARQRGNDALEPPHRPGGENVHDQHQAIGSARGMPQDNCRPAAPFRRTPFSAHFSGRGEIP